MVSQAIFIDRIYTLYPHIHSGIDWNQIIVAHKEMYCRNLANEPQQNPA